MHVELGQDALDVGADGVRGEVEPRRDLASVQAGCQGAQYLGFSGGEFLELSVDGGLGDLGGGGPGLGSLAVGGLGLGSLERGGLERGGLGEWAGWGSSGGGEREGEDGGGGQGCGVDAAADTELGQHVLHVATGGGPCDAEAAGDLLAGTALHHQVEDLALARGESAARIARVRRRLGKGLRAAALEFEGFGDR